MEAIATFVAACVKPDTSQLREVTPKTGPGRHDVGVSTTSVHQPCRPACRHALHQTSTRTQRGAASSEASADRRATGFRDAMMVGEKPHDDRQARSRPPFMPTEQRRHTVAALVAQIAGPIVRPPGWHRASWRGSGQHGGASEVRCEARSRCAGHPGRRVCMGWQAGDTVTRRQSYPAKRALCARNSAS